jgi:two-component system nitrogen regulation response regulator GlnG
MERLAQYNWPGNVRDLQSVVRESLLRSSGSVLLCEMLPPELLREESIGDETTPGTIIGEEDWQMLPRLVESWITQGESDVYRRALEHFDRLLVSRALQQSSGNQARASEILGLSRVTLRAKLRASGLAVSKQVTSQEVPALANDGN